jgi:hypothetical protein
MTDTTEQVVETTAPDAIAAEPAETPVEMQAESSPAVTDTDESSEPKPKGVQKRIDELTRLRHEAQRERDHWRELAMRQQAPAKQEPVAPETPAALPKLEDFNYDETAYQAALLKHATAEAARQVREELRQEENQRKQQERVKSWKTRESDFKAKNPDYEDVAYFAPISDAMAEIIQESEVGPELAYYLGKNLDEARQIAELDAVKAARAIGRIEAKLEKPAAAPAPTPKPPPVSKAPPPPPRIEATESAAPIRADSPDSDKLSDAEWMRLRNKQVQRKKA